VTPSLDAGVTPNHAPRSSYSRNADTPALINVELIQPGRKCLHNRAFRAVAAAFSLLGISQER